jgi:hypothetical protein
MEASCECVCELVETPAEERPVHGRDLHVGERRLANQERVSRPGAGGNMMEL